MSRLSIEIGDYVECSDGRCGVAVEIAENWVLVALETGGKPAPIERSWIISAERPKNDKANFA